MRTLHRHAPGDNDEAEFSRLLTALGARRCGDGWLACCPAHEDRHPSLSIKVADDRLLLHCFAGCDYRDLRQALRQRGLLDQTERLTRSHAGQIARRSKSTASKMPTKTVGTAHWAMRIWAESDPVIGTLGQTYLSRRGLALPGECVDIRFHWSCPRRGGRRQPALVWLMRDILTNQPRAIQRRFLRPDGTKDGNATSLGPCAGAVLKLSPDEEVTHGLAIAEGHADALAVAGDGWRPCWATCGTGAMESFPILDGVEALTIFADPNPAGRKAAERCRARWRAAGREVRILEPRGALDFGSVAERRAA